MDAAGVIIGVPGLIQSCVHGYRFAGVMLALDDDIAVLRLQYRIEETRFHLWARFWGLSRDNESDNQSHGGNDPVNSHALEAGSVERRLSHAQDFDDLLGLPGAEALVRDILKQTQALLDRSQTLSRRYDIDPLELRAAAGTGQTVSRSNRGKTRSRLRWAIKDRSSFEQILASLTLLNDGLERLLPRVERVHLGRALVGEVLADEDIAPGDKNAQNLSIALQASRQRHGEHDSQKPEDEADEPAEDGTSGRTNDHSDQNDSQSMQLPRDWFPNLQGEKEDRTIEIMFVPKSDNEAIMSDAVAHRLPAGEQTVFVEWRSYEETKLKEDLQMALESRREQIARLFQRKVDAEDREHYVLPCLGYLLLDEVTMGLVFSIPKESNGQYKTLNEVVESSYESEDAVPPDLDVRLALARKLSLALYQLQCAGWLHRMISSHNVVFFERSATSPSQEATLDFTRPYLAGWQTSRHDDQEHIQKSEGPLVFRKYPYLTREYGYLHPSRPKTRFRRSYDVYSLGVVLAELAFWEPIGALEGISSNDDGAWRDKWNDLSAWSQTIVDTCEKEIGSECGRRYKAAVMWCLRDLHLWLTQKWASATTGEGEAHREVGLEKAFYWKVVHGLDRVARIIEM